MAVLKKATIKSYNAGAHKASVQIAGSLAVWLDAVPVATDIPAADVVAGRECTVLFFDPSNPTDAVVLDIHGALPSVALAAFSIAEYVFLPDAAPAADVATGDQQGTILHSGPNAETALRLYCDTETAPGTSVVVTAQYADTDDLDTAVTWTTIATLTHSGKSSLQDTMTNASVPANRLLRFNVGAIVGTAPKDMTVTLRAKRPSVT